MAPRVRSSLRLSLSCIALLLACAAPLRAQDSLVVVPSLAGITVEDAREQLLARGLDVGALDETGGRGVPGTVARQQPRAGSRVAAGSSVQLTITASRRAVIPALTGLPVDRAIALLRQAGLEPGEVDGAGLGPNARVIGHSYHAGERVRNGTVINLSLGIPPGLAAREAVALREEPAPAPPPPPPARPARRAERPRPPAPAPPRVDSAAVPDVRRLVLAEARTALQGAGFDAAFDAALLDSAAWTVASQEPAAGARIAAGGVVTLALSAPPPPPAPVAVALPPVVPPPLASPLQPAPSAAPPRVSPALPPMRALWIVAALLVVAAAAAGARRVMRSRVLAVPTVRARLRTEAPARANVQGSPFGGPRLRLRVRPGIPSAAVSSAGPLFAPKGGAR